MAVIIRYFSTAGAGAADGTSWADRAAFLASGVTSTIITAFNTFNVDSLEARIGPGTYTLTTGIATFTGAFQPSVNFPCILQGADSSGNAWVPPNPGWVSAQPVWDDSTMPVLDTTTNISTVNNGNVFLRGLKFTASGRSGSVLGGARSGDWLFVTNSYNTTGAVGTEAGFDALTNSVIRMTSTSYSACVSGGPVLVQNTRFEGNSAASSGNRRGFLGANNSIFQLHQCTAINNVGGGILLTSTGLNARLYSSRCTVSGTGAANAGISIASTSTTPSIVGNAIIVNSGAFGIDVTGTGRLYSQNNRFRDNTSGSHNGMGSIPTTFDNYTTAATDADDFVDVANGDYRVKNTALIWGKGYGAGDQAAAGGGGSPSAYAFC